MNHRFTPMNTDMNDSDVLLFGVHRRSSVVLNISSPCPPCLRGEYSCRENKKMRDNNEGSREAELVQKSTRWFC